MTLVEMSISMLIGAIVLAALNSLVSLALTAQESGRSANEQTYAVGFALDRLVARTRATAPKYLSGTPDESTDTWLEPVMFCLEGERLMESSADDKDCKKGAVLAERVTDFEVERAASVRPADGPAITYRLTVRPNGAAGPVTLTRTVRLGGGAQ